MEKPLMRSEQRDYADRSNPQSSATLTDTPISRPTLPLHIPSYHLTRWKFLNILLDRIDHFSKGRAGWIQRFSTYFVIGGSAAVLNEIIFYIMLYQVTMPFSHAIHNLIANVIACELSTVANFAINDYVTFRHLDGHKRSWYARCLRFHITAFGGIVLTIVLQALFHLVGNLSPLISQTLAIGLVFIYNFTFHHIFTYRHIKA